MRPLVCDLDGTLIRNDTTHELCLAHVKKHPFSGAFQILRWVLSAGRGHMKQELGARYGSSIAPAELPYSDFLSSKEYRGAKHRALVSGSATPVVQKIGSHLGGFQHVHGSDATDAMTGDAKARYLTETYPEGFDYVGNSRADIPVWRAADRALGVNVSAGTERAAREAGIDLEVISRKPGWVRPLVKGMRLHQWSKNGLLFVNAFLNFALFTPSWIPLLLLGFLAFGLVTSATYLLNDLLDIEADRAHTRKSARPFASGTLGIPEGLAFTALLGLGGLLMAFLLTPAFGGMLACYAVLSLSYSFALKSVVMLDTMVLAFLFCWRVLAGAVLLSQPVSTWFVLALGFFFFSLALGKRCIELRRKTLEEDTLKGRGYHKADYPVVLAAGVGSSIASIVVVMIYVLLTDVSVINRDASAALISVLLIFWQMRFWTLVNRDAVHDDPVFFALTDRTSLTTLGLLMLVVCAEQLVPVVS